MKNMPQPSTNLFLTSGVRAACEAAITLYLKTLARMLPISKPAGITALVKDSLLEERTRYHALLDSFWAAAQNLAFMGNVAASTNQLSGFISEWGHYKAVDDLLTLGPLAANDPVVIANIQRRVANQVLSLASELLICYMQGEQEYIRKMEQAQVEEQQHWQQWGMRQEQIAHQMFHDQMKYMSEDHRMGREWANQASQAHSDAREALKVAHDGAVQMYQGVGQVFDYALGTQDQVVKLTEAIHQQGIQQLPREMEAAAERIESRRRVHKFGVFVVVLLGILVGCPLLLEFVSLVVTHIFPH